MLMYRLRNLREDNDLTQEKIASVVICDQATYSKYETENLNIPVESLIKLALFYNTSIDYLTGLTDEKKPYERSAKFK